MMVHILTAGFLFVEDCQLLESRVDCRRIGTHESVITNKTKLVDKSN